MKSNYVFTKLVLALSIAFISTGALAQNELSAENCEADLEQARQEAIEDAQARHDPEYEATDEAKGGSASGKSPNDTYGEIYDQAEEVAEKNHSCMSEMGEALSDVVSVDQSSSWGAIADWLKDKASSEACKQLNSAKNKVNSATNKAKNQVPKNVPNLPAVSGNQVSTTPPINAESGPSSSSGKSALDNVLDSFGK